MFRKVANTGERGACAILKRRVIFWGGLFGLSSAVSAASSPTPTLPATEISISVEEGGARSPLTGRMFVILSREKGAEPRLASPFAYYTNDPDWPLEIAPLFARDVEGIAAGSVVTLSDADQGYPLANLRAIPAGDYTVQVVLNVYTRFDRADGRVIWAHKDQGEGQQFQIAPGNLVSDPVRVHLDPERGFSLRLRLGHVLERVSPRPDTDIVKHVHFTSQLASAFWGQQMTVGATVVLPKGYAEHPERRYPVVFHQGHFYEGAAFSALEPPPWIRGEAGMRRWNENKQKFLASWLSEKFPRMIIVTLQHPTPFYDNSYFMNSPNTGPWSDVFLREVIPFIDGHYRTIAAPYARVLAGLSSGGGIAAYLQTHYPLMFGGAWIFAPDPVDFHDFYTVNLHSDDNAFRQPGHTWEALAPERYVYRSPNGQSLVTTRQMSLLSRVLGSRGRSGEWLDNYNAIYGSTTGDGYPTPVWNYETGTINRDIVAQWQANGFELLDYLRQHWATLAPPLQDKLHFAVGDMDSFFLNGGIYSLQDFIEHSRDPPLRVDFRFGRPAVGHGFERVGYDPFPIALLQEIADHIARHAAVSDDPAASRAN